MISIMTDGGGSNYILNGCQLDNTGPCLQFSSIGFKLFDGVGAFDYITFLKRIFFLISRSF